MSALVAACALALAPEVATTTLESIAERATVAFLGRADTLRRGTVPFVSGPGREALVALDVAELVVERPLWGAAAGERLLVVAEGVWACDATRVALGQECLWFLQPAPGPPERGDLDAFVAASGARPDLHRILHWGYGRLPVGSDGGVRAADVDASIVRLPESVAREARRVGDHGVRRAPLDAILAALPARAPLDPSRHRAQGPGDPPEAPPVRRAVALAAVGVGLAVAGAFLMRRLRPR